MIALKQLEETEAQLEKARVILEQAERTVRIGGVKPVSDGSFSLHAPKSGRIVDVRVASGATLEAQATAVLIDSVEEFWLQIQVPARVVGLIHAGDLVATDAGIKGSVIAISPALDPVFRSAALLARLPKDATLIVGQTLAVADLPGRHVVLSRFQRARWFTRGRRRTSSCAPPMASPCALSVVSGPSSQRLVMPASQASSPRAMKSP